MLSARSGEIEEAIQKIKEEINKELVSRTTTGRFDIMPDGTLNPKPNSLLSFVFGTFEPRKLGIIEFNPADRRYPPERFTNVTVDIEKQDEAWKQSAIYNTEGKYGGVKEALGNEWIRDIIRKAAGATTGTEEVATAMRDIFNDLIPDKEFNGPQPTREGRLEFVVRTGGSEHDIDDLSSGEKEILFGYLKTRARAPKNSVIIVDEPELHMNPRMIAGLPNLYERHIGAALQNQVWLVTHSDVFLRRAFESSGMQVFHMDMPRDQDRRFNQMTYVGSEKRYERACLELIGDIATYEPQGSTILVEGGSKLDEQIVTRLFADNLRGVNVVSIGGKNEVIKKKRELIALQEFQGIVKEVVSITDGDRVSVAARASEEAQGEFRWEYYDIESYLLDAVFIQRAVNHFRLGAAGDIPVDRIETLMRDFAREVMQEMIDSHLVNYVRSELKSAINRNVKKLSRSMGISEDDLEVLVAESKIAADAVSEVAQSMEIDKLKTVLQDFRDEFQQPERWVSGGWKALVPGKRVFHKLAEVLIGAGSAAQLRNVIIGLMATDGHKPNGMQMTIEKALAYRRSKTV